MNLPKSNFIVFFMYIFISIYICIYTCFFFKFIRLLLWLIFEIQYIYILIEVACHWIKYALCYNVWIQFQAARGNCTYICMYVYDANSK